VNPFLLAPGEAIRFLKVEREKLATLLAALPNTRTFIESFLAQADQRLTIHHGVLRERVKGWS
jgi:hypothetical protein